jgi:hypothetical protein
MAASRRGVAVALVAAGFSMAACDALIGLDHYHDVACAFDCGETGGAFSGEAGDVYTNDATDSADVTTHDVVADSPPEADVADVSVLGDVVEPDSGWPVPTGHELWAHWPMPNPDAAVGPDSSAQLPNQMSYDAGADGGSPLAYDLVTGLSWYRAPAAAASYDDAWVACSNPGLPKMSQPWRVPTRIELVSLIDFTQPQGKPAVDPVVFPLVTGALFWTSSAVPGDGGPSGYWIVDFSSGLTATSLPGAFVLCVSGGTP